MCMKMTMFWRLMSRVGEARMPSRKRRAALRVAAASEWTSSAGGGLGRKRTDWWRTSVRRWRVGVRKVSSCAACGASHATRREERCEVVSARLVDGAGF